MAEDQTFFRGRGKLPDGPGSESPVSVPHQDTLVEKPDCDQETWHVHFRTFSSSEESDPVQDLRRLRELCHLWLRPDVHTKEQMIDKLVLEQFMICMPLECQVLVKETGVQSCKALEDMLRNKQKPKKCTIVRIQGQEFLVRSSEVEMVESEASDMNDERDQCREPRYPVSEIPPENGQQKRRELHILAGAKDLSRGQDQKGLLPETFPETGEMEGLTPKENLEKDPMEDTEETRTHQSQEPEHLKSPEGEISTNGGYRKGSLRGLRGFKRKRANSPSFQEVPQEEATSLDKGEFSGQHGSPSTGSPSTVGPNILPEGKEAQAWAPYECRECKKRFPYPSQLTLHQRTHTGERPFLCNTCAKGFMQSSDLRAHERIHTGKKPYCCDLCPKKFTHDSTLRAHKRTHTKEKPFQCEHCDKAFSHRGNLNVHRRTHSGIKPYVCPECHSAFCQLGTFKRHQKIHSK
ncbi:zinc finger and SCAN domain-containing protein 5B-like [Eubalaena glacialis]|uniref:zinc finger and SCAN domain-containing protein 5B-like n=1 Tax=Eubalaena glacialis TaxID=27606 RepID=UPI002A5A3A7A|nr:zinc finger and SCAN domain-containing protein 5B-like [Eubalaena glacialis]